MKQNRSFTAEQWALALLMRREMKYLCRKIALKTNMSKTSVQRIVKQADCGWKSVLISKSNRGRQKSLSERDQRKLRRAIIQLREKDSKFYSDGGSAKEWNFSNLSVLQNVCSLCEKAGIRFLSKSQERGAYKERFPNMPYVRTVYDEETT